VSSAICTFPVLLILRTNEAGFTPALSFERRASRNISCGIAYITSQGSRLIQCSYSTPISLFEISSLGLRSGKPRQVWEDGRDLKWHLLLR